MMQTPRAIPRHIAIIMDGNGRWAQEKGFPRVFGHRAGAERVHDIIESCLNLGVEYVTLYAFSWENWDRPSQEIEQLMVLLNEFIRIEKPNMLQKGIRLNAIGRLDQLPQENIRHLHETIAETAAGNKLCLTLALSYGSRQEIVDAVRGLTGKVRDGKLSPDEIDEQSISDSLYTAGCPDPDLLIRTSGEMRLSNFLLWQLSYTEIYVTQKNWPDFDEAELIRAIDEFGRRDRRYGKTHSDSQQTERVVSR